ncbi:type I-E CRISPR-associated protein Cas6/Cse3/CasE [Paucidesulfovibrio longus]|uniref:type I-E CRISPR-associated protein Cas6/Cse3/CasE n=1 Tax=Paucidesulfovibrio longus TaxID=889 RepID=UPI0003B3DAAC|nr:type I-E CRISPR-associated protein Cas6/Cse3/CasE [Paucidesulfovibrio longus]
MYMSKLSFDPAALVRAGIYEMHQALWDVFSDGPERKRDFLFRDIGGGRDGANCFLAVSERPPVKSDFLIRREVKEYDPLLAVGDRVLFSVRVNPVRKTREGDKQKRYDVVQDLRTRLMEAGTPKHALPPRSELAEQAGRDWLLARQEGLGLEVEPETVLADGYAQDRFRKSSGCKPIVLGRLDLRGFARVANPDALRMALFQGVGCAKGFGFGLLLVRRA